MKELSRGQMKKINGGNVNEELDSGSPIYQCCWINTDNCSICVVNGDPNGCVTGAEARRCR